MTTTLPTEPFAVGVVVRVSHERGTFRVHGYGVDGSVLLWGGMSGHESWRSVVPGRLRRTAQPGPSRNPERGPSPTRKAGRR